MSNELGWFFPTDESDQWEGFNDPSIEHFTGQPIRHLAREIVQNAIDVSDGGTVQVVFKLRKVNTASIPNIDELRSTIALCSESADKESKKAQVFFENAKVELGKKQVTVLEVSDYNTIGMKGPSKNGTPFYAFMKATGQSRKDSSTATGSYGIGKFAPYVVSKVRTIFVSTVYDNEEGGYSQLTQGKSVLMSHHVDDSLKKGVGFWGVMAKCQPLSGASELLPGWIKRSSSSDEITGSKGTKLSILCFQEHKNWEELLAVSIAQNFFGSIFGGLLQVDINDTFSIEKSNLDKFFQDKNIHEVINGSSEESRDFENCKYYHDSLMADDVVQVEETESRNLGRCQVRILVKEGLPKKVCVLRNGMFITDYLNGLKSFNGFKEFVAVVNCLSDKGNELLRSMEPPRHDDFEPERLPTLKEQQKGKKALKDLSIWVRNMLKKHAKDPVSDVTSIDELKDFFGDEGGEGEADGSEDINPFGKVIVRAKPIKPKTRQQQPHDLPDGGDGTGNSGGGGAGETGGGSGEKGSEGGTGPGEGGSSGSSKKVVIPLANVRAIYNGSNKRNIGFTSTVNGRVAIKLQEVGADLDVDVAVSATDIGELNNGTIVLDVEKDKRVLLTVDLKQEFPGALKVVAYEI